MKAELFAQVKGTDPVPPDAHLPPGAWPAAVVLHEIERRMGMKPRESTDHETASAIEPTASQVHVDQTEPLKTTTPAAKPRRGLLTAAIAAVLVLVVILGTWLVIDRGEDAAASALGVGNDYIEAFNRGDAEAVLTLVAPNATIAETYSGMSEGAEPVDREFYEQRLAWDTAQGSILVSPECAVTDETAGVEVTVTCQLGWLNSAEQAIGKPPVPTVLTLVVTSAGISELAFVQEPQFGVAHFDQWMRANHPEDVAIVEFGDWSSVAEAEQGGRLRAQYVEEWAVFLEENNCVFTPGAADKEVLCE